MRFDINFLNNIVKPRTAKALLLLCLFWALAAGCVVYAQEPLAKEELALEKEPVPDVNKSDTQTKQEITLANPEPNKKEQLTDVVEEKKAAKNAVKTSYTPALNKLSKHIQEWKLKTRTGVDASASDLKGITNNALNCAFESFVSLPVDSVKALAVETATIVSVGQWDGVPQKKKDFNREVGLSGITSGDESKPPQVLTLKECIDIAEKNHLPLQIAKKSIRLAEVRVFEARRNLLPSATIGWEESTGRVNARAYISKKTYIEGQQPVFHGGELHYNLKQTQANLEITRNDYDRIKNELILQVKKGYYSYIKAKDNLRIQEELSTDAIKTYEMIKSQYESNIAPKLEFLNVSSQASQVKYQLASAQGDVSVAELILKQAMNIDTRDRIDVATPPPFKKVDLDFETTMNAAVVNRPEMKINSLMIDYYNYGKGIAKAKGFPKIDILGQWGLAKDEYMSEDANPGDDRKMWQQWYAGVKASMPFWGSTTEYSWTVEQWAPAVSVYQGTESATHALKFKILDKLDYYSDMKLAEIDYEKARQELIKIRQDVTLEVREGCFNYQKALIQLDTASSKVEYQAKDLEVMKMRRSLNEAADSAVIESMIKLAQERFGYAQAVSDCRIFLASVNKAVGVEDFYKDE